MGQWKKREARFHLASWTSLYPIGYDPCGAIFGAIRRPYSAPARFFADETPGSNRIIWYFADPSAVIYPDQNRFPPGIDFVAQNPPVQFESTGPNRSLRKYVGYRFHEYFPGAHWDGTFSDFNGKTAKSVYFPGHSSPANPCGDPILMYGIKLGAKVHELPQPRDVGLRLGGVASVPERALEICRGGFSFGGKVREHGLCGPYTRAGLELGAGVSDTAHAPAHLLGGIALGSWVTEPGGMLPVLSAGFKLGGLVIEVPHVRGGLELGSLVSIPARTPPHLLAALRLAGGIESPPTPFGGGFSLGGQVSTPSRTPPHLLGGIELGGIGWDTADLPPGPGASTCSTADKWGPWGSRTLTIAGGATYWWYHKIDPGATYHVSVVLNSGSVGSISIHTGASCSSFEFDSTFGVLPACTAFSLVVEAPPRYVWIEAQGALIGGPGNVTITLRPGPCP